MAKKKGKGKGKKKKEPKEENINTLTEVDKTFYELQITDLNRKLARLRELTKELEDKNIELEQRFSQLDDDRSDVIAYLKRTLQEKQNEVKELQERLSALQEAKDSESNELQEQIVEMENEYKLMREQLTSEIKLITGKLNALEEFRIQRDELMKKFEDQEQSIEEQEIRHKREIYEIEKKFIISKDNVKREMEKKILDLATGFKNVNEVRIAATTHRVIRENITINCEMEKMVSHMEEITKSNEELKATNKNLRLNMELYTTERDSALRNSKIQKGVIDQLTNKYKDLTVKLDEMKKSLDVYKTIETQLKDSQKDNENLNKKIRILEQNLHAVRCHELEVVTELEVSKVQLKQLKGTMLEAIESIKSVVQSHKKPCPDLSMRILRRENLLKNLLAIMIEATEVARISSFSTVSAPSGAYIRGDLGFIPKVPIVKPPPVIMLNMDSQVGGSLSEIGLSPEVSEEKLSKDASEVKTQEADSVDVFHKVESMDDILTIVTSDDMVASDKLSKESEEFGASALSLISQRPVMDLPDYVPQIFEIDNDFEDGSEVSLINEQRRAAQDEEGTNETEEMNFCITE